MPVPETYSRRIGSVREDSYSFSRPNRGIGSDRPSYLSSYTSKYTSSLPPRPPAYERKFSELNTSSTTGSRYLNGTTGGISRSASNYGTSAYTRSSVSPGRNTSSGLRRSLEGISSSATPSLSDRLRSLEIGSADKDTGNNTSGSGYKYLTRNRDSSAGGATTTNTGSSRYGAFSRDRSGSRELTSSPLTTSPLTLGSRTDMKSELLKSRSGSSPFSDVSSSPLSSSSYGRTSRLSSSGISNGIASRITGTEVTNPSVVSSGSESTSATPTTNSVVSSNKKQTKIEGDAGVDRDVENNDDPRSSSSTTTTSTISSSSSAAIECSASPIISNNDEVVISLKNMNGNDTVDNNISKDVLSPPSSSLSSSSSSSTTTTTEKTRRSSGGGGDDGVAAADSSNNSGGGGGGAVDAILLQSGNDRRSPAGSSDSSPTSTLVYDQDTNGNPIVVLRHNKSSERDDSNVSSTPPESKITTKIQPSSVPSQTPTKTKTKTASSATTTSNGADSNANVVPTTRKSVKSASALVSTPLAAAATTEKGEIGVKKSLLKPNPLGSTKVQTKSKIIIHKFKVEDGTTATEDNAAEKETPKRRSVKSATAAATAVAAATKSGEEKETKEETKSASATTLRKKSAEENRHSNNDVTATISLKSFKPSKKSQEEKSKANKEVEEDAVNLNQNKNETTTEKLGEKNQNSSSVRESSPAGAGLLLDRAPKTNPAVVEKTIVIKRASPPASEESHKDAAAVAVKVPPALQTLKEPSKSKSRSPSPSTSVTITLSPPRKVTTTTAVEPADTENLNNLVDSSSSSSITTTAAKAPTPPPLPKPTSTTTSAAPLSTSSSYRLRRDTSDDVTTTDSMAGPHSSKYAGRHGKSDSSADRSSTERDYRTPAATTTTRNTYVNSTSDSSDNDSEEYSRSPPTTGRFRTRDAEKAGLTGLRNIGNTCFMNSVLQCLSNTKPLLEYVNNDSYLNDINASTSSMKGALMRAFAQLIQELWRETRPVDTSAFKDQIQRFAPRFMGYSQQDAQEFLRYLLEGLHEDVNRVTVKPKPIMTDIDDSLRFRGYWNSCQWFIIIVACNFSRTVAFVYTFDGQSVKNLLDKRNLFLLMDHSLSEKIYRKLKDLRDGQKATESWKRYLRYDDSKIVDIFVGQLKSTLRCTTCGHCSVTFDPFWDLSLPIPGRMSSVKLSNCFELFTREEVLDGDEKPTCSKCQCRRKCTKSLSIQKFPKILVIHLKRFSPTERYRGKLSTTVEYPLKGLDLTAFAANSAQHLSTFNLYGISNHSGSTYSGHYIAYCKHPYSGEWHCYNDSRVSPVTTNSVVSSEGYVLFYENNGQTSHL